MVQYRSDETIRTLAALVADRDASFLAHATAQAHADLVERFQGRRVVVLGAAGFIATQTIRPLLGLNPAYVALVDISENGLAEAVRSIRSGDLASPSTTVEPWLIDISRPSLDRLLEELGSVDVVLNFAAIKHVRSERDLPSLLRMLEVNVLGSHRAARAFRTAHPEAPQFLVSTDKAADPANFMGASKRAMELAAAAADPSVTTARFANVAFSSGSLLESWLIRLENGQPLAVPRDTWRYFVTPQEAGEICLLGSVAPPGSIVVPDFTEDSLVALTKALDVVLDHVGLTALPVESVAAGLSQLAAADDRRWPVLTTPRDTAGEKQAEIFLGAAEGAEEWVEGLRRLPVGHAGPTVEDLLERISHWVENPLTVTLREVHSAMAAAVPNFEHIGSEARLDDRA